MNIKTIFLCFVAMAMIASCSKDDDNSKNCEEDGFGYLKVNVPSTTVRTSVIVTGSNGQNFEEEIIAPNKTSVTIELDMGVYSISVTRIDENGNGLGDPVTFSGISIEQCETTEQTIGAA